MGVVDSNAVHIESKEEATAVREEEKDVQQVIPSRPSIAKKTTPKASSAKKTTPEASSAKKTTPSASRLSSTRKSRRLSINKKAVEADAPVVRVSMVPAVPPTPQTAPKSVEDLETEARQTPKHPSPMVSVCNDVPAQSISPPSVQPTETLENNINASSFPSVQVFDQMVDISISMVNSKFASIENDILVTKEKKTMDFKKGP